MNKATEKRVNFLIKDPARVKPDFIANPNIDKLISVVMRLAMENSVLKDRIVRQEELLILKGFLTVEDIDGYEPDQETSLASQAESFDLIRSIINDLE